MAWSRDSSIPWICARTDSASARAAWISLGLAWLAATAERAVVAVTRRTAAVRRVRRIIGPIPPGPRLSVRGARTRGWKLPVVSDGVKSLRAFQRRIATLLYVGNPPTIVVSVTISVVVGRVRPAA